MDENPRESKAPDGAPPPPRGVPEAARWSSSSAARSPEEEEEDAPPPPAEDDDGRFLASSTLVSSASSTMALSKARSSARARDQNWPPRTGTLTQTLTSHVSHDCRYGSFPLPPGVSLTHPGGGPAFLALGELWGGGVGMYTGRCDLVFGEQCFESLVSVHELGRETKPTRAHLLRSAKHIWYRLRSTPGSTPFFFLLHERERDRDTQQQQAGILIAYQSAIPLVVYGRDKCGRKKNGRKNGISFEMNELFSFHTN